MSYLPGEHPSWVRCIRFAFWALYNPLAWTYDCVSRAVSLGSWRSWQREGLTELHGKRVLELAFGTGDILLDLHTRDYDPIGLELSPQMVRIAQRKLYHRGACVPLVRGRSQRLPFADASFDSLLSTFPAEFIAAPDTLNEMARILRPGGRAVVVVMAQFNSDGLRTRFLEWLYRITGQRGPLPELGAHLNERGLTCRTQWRSTNGTSVLLAILEKRVDD